MRICMVGTGYVGLVTAACFAEQGNEVWCVDVDSEKVQQLQNGQIPIFEPGLQDIVKRNAAEGNLHFTTDLAEGVRNSLFIFIAVGTPTLADGSSDLQYVFEVARGIGECMDAYKLVVVKSTVPVGTTLAVDDAIRRELAARQLTDLDFDVAFCPEFLKEGSAVEDFMKPDRIIIGAENSRVAELLKELYSPFNMREPRILTMRVASAELSKYAANAMLATRISFMNELAGYCDLVGADIEEIRRGIGADSRIGSAFLYAGLGYGGSCFPKDLKALIGTAATRDYDFSILRAVEEVNQRQRQRLLDKIRQHFAGDLAGRRFALWGLSFKPHTDDIREAPALDLIRALLDAGASVTAFDPVAAANVRKVLGDNPAIQYVQERYEALRDADALVLVTEWPAFRKPDFERMKTLLRQPVIFDGRNQYDPTQLRRQGFTLYTMGRGRHGQD